MTHDHRDPVLRRLRRVVARARGREQQHPRWRLPAIGAFVLAGALCVTTALNSNGLDLRESSVTDLDHVLLQERQHVQAQQARVAALTQDVKELTGAIGDTTVARLQDKVGQLQQPAGFTAVHGPGVTVTLDDAPESTVQSVEESGEYPLDALVIHQQDIQAVVNALWAGGAEAISIKDVRIISTTGIRCVGNTVILHGVYYSPPYTIKAIGGIDELEASLAGNDYVRGIIKGARDYDLGYDVEPSADLEIPAFNGSPTVKYAERAPASVERN